MRSDKTGRSQTAATALQVGVAAPVRARTAGLQPEKPRLHDQPRRAVDCAPYRLSAPLGRFDARPSCAEQLLRPEGSRAGADWSAAILAAVTSSELKLVAALFPSGIAAEL